IVNTLILTLSRGAFLGFVAGGLTAGYFIPGVFRKRFVWLSCLALVLLSLLAHEQFTERLWNLYESLTSEEVEIDNSASSRLAIFKAGMEIGKSNLLGSGYKATPALSARYLDPRYHASPGVGRSAHNTFAAVFAEHGVPGTILYFSIVLWVLLHLFKPPLMPPGYGPKDRALSVGMAAALVGMYVSGNFSNNADTETQYWILALICAQLANSRLEAATAEESADEEDAREARPGIAAAARGLGAGGAMAPRQGWQQ
ncbi:MAG: O-antigen ligase family protein, partial [Halieaceae bacterium]|nr:O-antigen ligase family protein [Halieaceae bacterium]